MPLFPPAIPVTVTIDGRPLPAYVRAYEAGGRVFVPVDPLLARLADRIWFDGDDLVLERGDRRVRIRLAGGAAQLDGTYVPAGPVLRGLGLRAVFEPARRRLAVRGAANYRIASPQPFDPNAPSAPPSVVFTPSPNVTPRPVWSGSPQPRRTPLPLAPPS